MLLWTQLKNCLELMKKTSEEKMRAEELTKRRMILEQRSDHLKEMKKRSRLEPVISEQVEPEFENMETLCRTVNKLRLIPVDPNKCEVVIPPVIMKTTTSMIMLKNKNNNLVTNCSEELNVFIENVGDGKAIRVRPISTLVNPYGIAVTDNVIAVSDYGSHQVKKYCLQGELLSVIGCHGNKNGEFNYPRGLAFNNNKLLYVVDERNYRVQVFQQDDKFAFSFGNRGSNPGQFLCPDKIAIDHNNNVLVTDNLANCIVIFTQSGEFIQTMNSYRPCAITISPTGYLITNHVGYDNKIRVWSDMYQCIKMFDKKGYKFIGIGRMAIDSSETTYICCRVGQQETTSYQ